MPWICFPNWSSMLTHTKPIAVTKATVHRHVSIGIHIRRHLRATGLSPIAARHAYITGVTCVWIAGGAVGGWKVYDYIPYLPWYPDSSNSNGDYGSPMDMGIPTPSTSNVGMEMGHQVTVIEPSSLVLLGMMIGFLVITRKR